MANTNQEPQKDLSPNPSSSGTFESTSKRTIKEANTQSDEIENSRKKARFGQSKKQSKSYSPHTRDYANKSVFKRLLLI